MRLLVLAIVAALAPARADAKKPIELPLPATGVGDAGETFVGTFTLTDVVNDDGVLTVVGNLVGTITDAAGNLLDVDEVVSIPVTITDATCDILSLALGPVDLDLLGLVIHLDPIFLDIDAQAAPGNLLGNLLCAIAHLLDGPAPINAIVALLTNILAILTDVLSP
jgi:hypothetical protein